MNLRKLRWYLIAYVLFDLLIGGRCGGFLPLSAAAAAQFTTVSGTVTDPNGLPYANGTIVPILIISGSPVFTATNSPYTPPSQPIGLDGSGHFVMQLADVTQLSPGGGAWNFTVCSGAGTVNPSFGKGSICFGYGTAITLANITISGSSQDISTQLNAVAPALTAAFGGGGGGIGGSGTTGAIPRFTNATTLGVSPIFFVATSPQLVEIAGAGGVGTFNTTNGFGVFTNIVAGQSSTCNAGGSLNPLLGQSSCYGAFFQAASATANALGITAGLLVQNSSGDNLAAGIASYATNNGVAVTELRGVEASAGAAGLNVTNNRGLFAFAQTLSGATSTNQQAGYFKTNVSSGSTVTNDANAFCDSPFIGASGATMTHHYCLYIADQTGAGSGTNPDPWGIFEAVAGNKNQFGTSTFIGKVTTLASAAGGAGLNLPPGAAPTVPVNGDCWTTAAGLFCQIAGVTVGPYGTGGGGGTSAGVQFASQYSSNGSGGFGGTSVPSTNGLYNLAYNVTSNAAVAPGPIQVGFGTFAISGATNSFTVAYNHVDAEIDHDEAASSAVTVTIPTPTTLQNSTFAFTYCNSSPLTDSLAPTTWTIQTLGGASAATLAVPTNVCYRVSIDPFNATNWLAHETTGAYLGTPANALGSPISITDVDATTTGFSPPTLPWKLAAGGNSASTATPGGIGQGWYLQLGNMGVPGGTYTTPDTINSSALTGTKQYLLGGGVFEIDGARGRNSGDLNAGYQGSVVTSAASWGQGLMLRNFTQSTQAIHQDPPLLGFFSPAWRTDTITSIAVTAGGSSWTTGDIVVPTGRCTGAVPEFVVTASGGVMQSVTPFLVKGLNPNDPGTPVSGTGCTGGAGTSLVATGGSSGTGATGTVTTGAGPVAMGAEVLPFACVLSGGAYVHQTGANNDDSCLKIDFPGQTDGHKHVILGTGAGGFSIDMLAGGGIITALQGAFQFGSNGGQTYAQYFGSGSNSAVPHDFAVTARASAVDSTEAFAINANGALAANSVLVNCGNVITSSVGTNLAGGDCYNAPGWGTGTGATGTYRIGAYVSTGSSGTTQQTWHEGFAVNPGAAPTVTIDNTISSYSGLSTAGIGVTPVQAAPAVVTIGSGTSIAATSLCSTTNCPAGDYVVHAYLDITTACTTTGSYIVWLGWTDDAGAKAGSSVTTFIPIAGNGVTTSTGSLALASTANYGQGSARIRTTGAATGGLGSINYGTTATACGTGGPMVGNLYLDVVRLR